MCGIAGYISHGAFDPRLSTALAILAIKMETRGTQSWGWTDGNDIYKEVGLISLGLCDRRFYRTPVAWIHTRHATQGAVIAENSHPYLIKGIVGMHNGMLDNHHQLNALHPDRECVVDSQHIFHQIADGLPLSEISGYGTIAYSQDGKYYIGHFHGGELAIAYGKAGYLFASTSSALQVASRLAGFADAEWKIYKTNDGELYEMASDGLMIAGKLPVSEMWSGSTWDNVRTGADDWKKYFPEKFGKHGTERKKASGTAESADADYDADMQRLLADGYVDGADVTYEDDEENAISVCNHCGIECNADEPMFELSSGDRFICEQCTIDNGLDVSASQVTRIEDDDAVCVECGTADGSDVFIVDGVEEMPLCIACLVEYYHSQLVLAPSKMFAK